MRVRGKNIEININLENCSHFSSLASLGVNICLCQVTALSIVRWNQGCNSFVDFVNSD
jgi:hypothetical protein